MAALPTPLHHSGDARIPTIDFNAFLKGSGAQRQAVIDAVGNAAEVYGFMILVGHGLPLSVIAGAFDAAHDFFVLPEAQKERVREHLSDRGYQPSFDNTSPEGKPISQESFTLGHPILPQDQRLLPLSFYAPTPWPEGLPGFREGLEAAYWALFNLGKAVLDAMALHLNAPSGFFDAALQDTYSHLRLNHYPPQHVVAHISDEGVHAHFDESLITLLMTDANSGLEVLGKDGRWIAVEPNPEAVIVNVGKMLRHWSNGRYNAALHKVLNLSGNDRYSVPLFLHPSFNTVVDPRDLIGAAADSVRFPPQVAGETVFASFAEIRKSWQE